MAWTVFYTVLSGLAVYVIGQLLLKFVIEPVHETGKTIGEISHSLILFANVISNPGVPSKEKMDEASDRFRKLSGLLHTHLFLVPWYGVTAGIFRLPARNKVLTAASQLIGLSNSVHTASAGIYEQNAKRVEKICDSLGIYLDPNQRWPAN